MKYMLLMMADPKLDATPITTWAPEEITAHIDFMRTVNRDLVESGELVDAQGLAWPQDGKVVRDRGNGDRTVTDGPFAESKEFLAGYWIVDVEDIDRAVEIAARVSTAPGPNGVPVGVPIEVRQVMSEPPADL